MIRLAAVKYVRVELSDVSFTYAAFDLFLKTDVLNNMMILVGSNLFLLAFHGLNARVTLLQSSVTGKDVSKITECQ